MVRRAESPTYESASSSVARPIPILSHSSGHAVGRMTAAFTDRDPILVLVSRWPQNARFMVDKFVEMLPDDVTVARVTAPCHGAASTLRSVLTAFGIKQMHLNIKLLEEELERILVEQMNFCRRTLICFEAPDEIESWVLDRVQRLIELEEREKFGLTVILSGGPKLRKLLTKPPFDKIALKAEQPIVAGPLILEETRDYITRQIRTAGVSNIYQVFDFAAMTAVHEFSGGLTDRIDALCCKCIELADKEDKRPVTPATVQRANVAMTQADSGQAQQEETAPDAHNDAKHSTARLVARVNGSVSHEVAVRDGHMLIGRAQVCDIPLASLKVSRHHAMVVQTASGVGLVDMGSTNGTFIDGKRIEQHMLRHGDQVRLGDCTITFFEGTD